MNRREILKRVLENQAEAHVNVAIDKTFPGFTTTCNEATEEGADVSLHVSEFSKGAEDALMLGTLIQYANSIGVPQIVIGTNNPRKGIKSCSDNSNGKHPVSQ